MVGKKRMCQKPHFTILLDKEQLNNLTIYQLDLI